MIIVVSDTSPIRALAFVDELDLLQKLFDRVLVPPRVEQELISPPLRFQTVSVGTLPWIEVRAPADRAQVDVLRQQLDEGESEAIALALEVGASKVLIDELAGREMATKLGLVPLGVLGVLLQAKQRQFVPRIRPLIDRLQQELGFFVSSSVRDDCLRQAGE